MIVSKPLHRYWLNALVTASLLVQCFWIPPVSQAKSDKHTKGEFKSAKSLSTNGQLTSAKSLSINGTVAFAGQTVFKGSKIVVGERGFGAINLSSLGRLEIGANTEYVLQRDSNLIAGQLINGTLQISTAVAAPVNIQTAVGYVSVAGGQSTSFTMGFSKGILTVTADLGDVTIISSGKTATVSAGQLLKVSSTEGVAVISVPEHPAKCVNGGEISVSCRRPSAASDDVNLDPQGTRPPRDINSDPRRDQSNAGGGTSGASNGGGGGSTGSGGSGSGGSSGGGNGGGGNGGGGGGFGGVLIGIFSAAAATAFAVIATTVAKDNTEIKTANGFTFRCINGNCTLVSPTSPN